MRNVKEIGKVYKEIEKYKFPEEAVERTSGVKTTKGYDTTGFGYQYIVNGLNSILELDGWMTTQSFDVSEGTTSKGKTAYSAVATIEIHALFCDEEGKEIARDVVRHAHGSHTSLDRGDAMKGAYTNGLKKAAAMLGLGRQAYEGSIDDDNKPIPEVVKPVPGRTPTGRIARTRRQEPPEMQLALAGQPVDPIDDFPVPFGRNKGQMMSEQSLRDLEWYGKTWAENADDPEKARWRDKTLEELDIIRAWYRFRKGGGTASPADPAPASEPGYPWGEAGETQDDPQPAPAQPPQTAGKAPW